MLQERKLTAFLARIGATFGLERTSRELLALVTATAGCRRACIVFLDPDNHDFSVSFCRPRSRDNPLAGLRLAAQNPLIKHLELEKKRLVAGDFPSLSEGASLQNIAVLVPVVSRNKLIGVLALNARETGQYSPDVLASLQEIADRTAPALEKEYLREQLNERVAELSVIGRSAAILTSSLDIPGIFDRFIRELKKVLDIDWAAVVLVESGEKLLAAVSSQVGSPWVAGDRIPASGTATEWVVNNRKALLESDLGQENRFVTAAAYHKRGMRSIVHLPLISGEEAFGALIVASRRANAYSSRHVAMLEQLTAQIAMPIENSRLYSQVREQAFVDKLTGLHNRRALDETIANEISRNSRYGGIFSLIILDIDSLKDVNDRYGHLAGDNLLRRTGDAIRNSIRSADHAFRYGGDEFAILLPNTVMDAAFVVAERIRHQIASKTNPGEMPVSASLGLAGWPGSGKTANEVIAAADAALYRAKWNGGNCTRRADVPPQE